MSSIVVDVFKKIYETKKYRKLLSELSIYSLKLYFILIIFIKLITVT